MEGFPKANACSRIIFVEYLEAKNGKALTSSTLTSSSIRVKITKGSIFYG